MRFLELNVTSLLQIGNINGDAFFRGLPQNDKRARITLQRFIP